MKNVWVFSRGRLGSISSEEEAAALAEKYPATIYFFADKVSHPNSK